MTGDLHPFDGDDNRGRVGPDPIGPAGLLEEVLREYAPWADATFSDESAEVALLKLVEEAEEALDADRELRAEELADVVFVAVFVALRSGIDLAEALAAKLSVLRLRTWERPSPDQPYSHVRP